jgi:hypothetical protein
MSQDTLTQDTNGAVGQIAADVPVLRVESPSAVEIAEAITASAAGPLPLAQPTLPPPVVDKQPMGPVQRGVIGTALVTVTALLMLQLLVIWPAVMAATPVDPDTDPSAVGTPVLFGLTHIELEPQVVLILMVLMAGALGALVGGSRRFLYFATRDELTKRDEWSYVIRPMQGAALALIVYFTLRGGYLGQDPDAKVNPYGVAALSALVGLFTRHAVSKLTDVFDTLFGKPKEDVAPVEVKDAAPDADSSDDSDEARSSAPEH